MTSEATCYHCGLPLPGGRPYVAVVDGQPHAVCCPGCRAVAETIGADGLSAYYRTRTAFAPAQSEPADDLCALRAYDGAEIQASFVRRLGERGREAVLILEGITCAACVWLIEEHLARVPGVVAVDVNYATRRARVRWDEDRVRLSELLRQVGAIGYRAWPATSRGAEALRVSETRAALWRLFVAGFGMMQVMMYALPAYFADDGSMSVDVRLLMRLASLLLTVPVVFYSAWPFFRGAWRDLARRRLGMDVPIALGIGAAFAASLTATFLGGAEVYYDSLTMFVFFLLGARFLEMRARHRSASDLEYLDKALPVTAHRLADYPRHLETEDIPAVALRAGDYVVVRPGESLPADAELVQGETQCDESLLTGESTPVRKGVGDEVVGGALNRLSTIVARVTRVGEDMRTSAIRRLVEAAAAERPAFAYQVDRLAPWFVGLILMVAAASAIAWLRLDPARALSVTVAVLVVSCPCALSLATPAAMTVAIGRLSRRGVVAVRAHAIEALASVTHVVFDKTGTLTEGRLGLAATTTPPGVDADWARAIAATLEEISEHAIAAAFLAECPAGRRLPATERRNEPGAGIEGRIGGTRYRLGTAEFVKEIAGAPPAAPAPGSATRVWLGADTQWLAAFDLVDRLRPEAHAVIGEIKRQAMRVLIWSGDAPGAVEDVARRVGADGYAAGLLPHDKQARMAELQREGAVVAMIGDGVNDAPVLAQAQVSVAMGSGALLSQAHADMVLLSGTLRGLLDALALAARTRRIVRQSLAWAVVYNLAALPLAAVGLVPPWLAGIGMGISSLAVVLNALRVARGGYGQAHRQGAKAEQARARAVQVASR